MKRIASTITTVLGSRTFLYVVLACFVLDSLWVAVSAAYPMAFDEEYHLGLITIYSDHWLPFLASQPDNANQFGAVARDPSFFYHWLMSFPARLFTLFTDSQTALVIFLRTLNIGIVAASLVLYVKAMGRMGASAALQSTALAVFVLIPIVPLLAGQINYDSLFMFFVAALCLLTFSLIDQARALRVRPITLGLFVVVCMLGSLTKYAFLPVAVAAAIIVIVVSWRYLRHALRKVGTRLATDTKKRSASWKVGMVVLLLLSTAFFLQRYGVNVMRYHTPVPDCSAVIGVDACKEYGPWRRNYRMASEKTTVNPNPLAYTGVWLQGLHYRMFFMVNGPHHGYASYPPAPLPSATTIVILISGTTAMVLYFRRIFKDSLYIRIGAGLSLAYITVLWLNNYTDFLQTAWPVAINGRYLLPVLLLVAPLWGKALATAWSPWPWLKPVAASAVILLFLQGGGVFSYILRSDSTWYWPNQMFITDVNDTARKILEPITFEGPKYY